MEFEENSEDPVVKELDVHLSQSLTRNLFLLQHPLHPSRSPQGAGSIVGARVCGEGEGVELDVRVRPRGENYSTSRGEHYARMVSLGTKNEPGNAIRETSSYKSDLLDTFTLTSTPTPLKTPRYAAAIYRNGALHLTPLRGLVQLRPSLSYLDKADIGAKRLEVAATSSDGGDTTESEGEDAKPVTVRFAKQENMAKSSQKKVGHRMTFTEVAENRKSDEVWRKVEYFGMESEEAEEERRLLLAGSDDQHLMFSQSEEKFLDSIFPKEASGEKESANGASLPIGVISLEQIKKLPLKRQVLEVLRNAHMIQFGQLCSLLGVTGGKMGGVLEAVMGCAVLVQGCWVVASHEIFPDSSDVAKRNARDYILWCFTQRRLVPRMDIMGVVRLPNEEVRQLMQSLAVQRFHPQHGWEFKLDTDTEFNSRNANIRVKEDERWSKRHKELLAEINMKSPASTKVPVSASMETSSGQSAGGTSGDSGGKESVKGHKKGRVSREDPNDTNIGTVKPPKLSLTPTRSSTSGLQPQAIAMSTDTITTSIDIITTPTDMDTSNEVAMNSSEDEHAISPRELISASLSPGLDSLLSQALSSHPANSHHDELDASIVKKEEPSLELMDALVELCQETIGRGVVGLSEIRDKLLLKQTSVGEGHPLREQGIPDGWLENGLQLCGAMEVGQPCGRRLFAFTHDDKCRSSILELCQKHKVIKKKQVIELMGERQIYLPDKVVIKYLKELCYSKGGHWRLLGT